MSHALLTSLRHLSFAAAALLWVPTALALAPGETEAGARVETFSSYRPSTGPDVQSYLQGEDSREGRWLIAAGASQLAMAAGGSGPIANAAAGGWAAPGAAGVTAASTATGVPNAGLYVLNGSWAMAESNAGWWDTLLITSPQAANGTAGTLKAHVLISGSVLASVGPFFSQSFAEFKINGIGMGSTAGCQAGYAYCTNASAGGYNGWADGTRSFGNTTIGVEVPFVFGQPFEIGFWAYARSYAQGVTFTDGETFTQADGLSSFGSTARWGGIDGVYRGNALVASYALSSGTGTDFNLAINAPVPEAPPGLLLLAGLGLLGWLKRHTAATRR
ncbi:MAG: hypothetical protein ACT6S0_02430 [Roseateles sp.]|uniref:hypothetical protein n=1 Tax=Roseateles sp. TaxID=1971397 RepID=UPI004036E460